MWKFVRKTDNVKACRCVSVSVFESLCVWVRGCGCGCKFVCVKSSVRVLHMAIISLTEVNKNAILIFFT